MQKPSKIYPAQVGRRRMQLLPLLLALLVAGAFMQGVIDPTIRRYHEQDTAITVAGSGLNNEFLLLPLLGFREATAGLLWVRCDEFFHSGDYDAILPLVRIITWLDPHAENVYVTGAWHLAYNFTDSAERSDRRYIAPSQALLDEGIRNNMNIPDIKFEKGWECYDKIKDFVSAERAFKMAIDTPPRRDSDDWPYGAPLKTLHTLAHTYEKQGRIPEALAQWQTALKRSEEMLRRKPDDPAVRQLQAAEKHNYQITQQRYFDRYTTANHSKEINPSPYPAVVRPVAGDTAQRPWDASLSTEISVTRPKVLKISGRFNSADGARVDLRITDWDYVDPYFRNRNSQDQKTVPQLSTFDVDMSQTILVDSLSVRKNKFQREIDMSKDLKMYSFRKPYYRITLFYNPRTTSPHLHDRFGWSGEGVTDSSPAHVWLDRSPELLGTKLIEGQGGTGAVWDGRTIPWGQFGQPPRLIRVTYKVSLGQIMGSKSITAQDIVPND